MKLSPREKDKLLVSVAAMVATGPPATWGQAELS